MHTSWPFRTACGGPARRQSFSAFFFQMDLAARVAQSLGSPSPPTSCGLMNTTNKLPFLPVRLLPRDTGHAPRLLISSRKRVHVPLVPSLRPVAEVCTPAILPGRGRCGRRPRKNGRDPPLSLRRMWCSAPGLRQADAGRHEFFIFWASLDES